MIRSTFFVLSVALSCAPLLAEGPSRKVEAENSSDLKCRFFNASISRSLTTGPTATVDLGNAAVSERIRVIVSLTNDTSDEIKFDDIAASCSCLDVIPKSGVIAPGKSLEFGMTVATVDYPGSLHGYGLFDFKNRGATTFTLEFSYQLAGYFGIPRGLIVSDFSPTRTTEALTFVSPIVMSSDVNVDDINFSLGGIEGRFEYEIDKMNQRLVGKIDAVVEPGETTIYGSLDMTDRKRGKVSATPIVFQRQDMMRVYPNMVRFVKGASVEGASEGIWVAVCYVKLDRSITEPGGVLSAEPSIDGLDGTISSSVSTLEKNVFKVVVTVTDSKERERSASLESLSEIEAELRTLRLRLVFGKTSVYKDLDFSVQGK